MFLKKGYCAFRRECNWARRRMVRKETLVLSFEVWRINPNKCSPIVADTTATNLGKIMNASTNIFIMFSLMVTETAALPVREIMSEYTQIVQNQVRSPYVSFMNIY